jgi:hypothetical protein
MSDARRCPIPNCGRVLGVTRDGDPYALCPYHFKKLDVGLQNRLWRAYRAWQRLDRQYRRMQLERRLTPAITDARAEGIKVYLEIRDDAIRFATRGEGEQLEVAL